MERAKETIALECTGKSAIGMNFPTNVILMRHMFPVGNSQMSDFCFAKLVISFTPNINQS